MRPHAHAWIAVGLCWVMLACPLPAAADNADLGTQVTGPAIEKLMAGNTLGGTFAETGEQWAEYYCDTGKSLYDFRDRIALGKWWVSKAEVCFSYDWSDYQHVQCFNLYAKPDGSLTLVAWDTNGERAMTFRSNPPRPGDPLHLEQRAVHGCQPEPSV